MDGERADRTRERLISRRQKSQMDRGERAREEGGVRLQMSARVFFSFDQNNDLFPLHQSHQSETAPFTLSFCMHDDIFVN